MNPHQRTFIRRALTALVLVVTVTGCHLQPDGTVSLDDSPTAIIHEEFGPAGDSAVRVAQCESSLDPAAVGGPNYGLFQISRVHADDFVAVTGQPWSEIFSGYWNTVYAKHLYDQSGWSPWSCRWAA